MFKRKIITPYLLLTCIAACVTAQKPVLRTNVNPIVMKVNGVELPGGWAIAPEMNPDEFITTSSSVSFISDCDSINVDLNEWESRDFTVVIKDTDSANIRVTRRAVNPYENPDPRLLKVAPSGLLTKEQAAFDINALIYSLNQIHPDIFSVCKQEDLMRAVNRTIKALPDSLSILDLYQSAAPIVAMIGDGHTNLAFPFNSVFTAELKRMPLFGRINSNREFTCISSLDSIIPVGAKVLSINGTPMNAMIDSMMPYVSGEREHFKLSGVDSYFTALHEMLFHADEYVVTYLPQNTKKPLTVTLPGTVTNDIIKRCPFSRSSRPYSSYSYTTDSAANVAVMEFNSFRDMNKMTAFADSMFRDLRHKSITNLIIDIRNNGGGASEVGDVLLRYISNEPFVQMDKVLIKITPLTVSLMNRNGVFPQLTFVEDSENEFIKPRTNDEGHYNGKVYLLTSNRTFSSASSFAWAFKECNMGTVIGEETGGMNVCYGDILMYRLPVSKLECSVSFKRFWQLRADETDIHGTIPDVSVPAADAMDAAMRLVKKNKRKKK